MVEFKKKECLPHCAMQAGRLDFSVPADGMAFAWQAGLLPFFVSRQRKEVGHGAKPRENDRYKWMRKK